MTESANKPGQAFLEDEAKHTYPDLDRLMDASGFTAAQARAMLGGLGVEGAGIQIGTPVETPAESDARLRKEYDDLPENTKMYRHTGNWDHDSAQKATNARGHDLVRATLSSKKSTN